MHNPKRRPFRSRSNKNGFRARNNLNRSNNNSFQNNNGNNSFKRNGMMTNPFNIEKTIQKYQQLAKDAQSFGDPVIVENYLQHVDHYSRRLAEISSKKETNFENKTKESTIKNSKEKINAVSEANKIKTENV